MRRRSRLKAGYAVEKESTSKKPVALVRILLGWKQTIVHSRLTIA